MALLACLGCGCRFAVGLEWCPQCGSEEFEEADVPKITSAGVSYPQEPGAGEPAVEAPAAVEAAADPAPEAGAAAAPPVSAVKAEHVEYAVEALGVPPEEAESMTKPELVELAKAPPSLSRAPES